MISPAARQPFPVRRSPDGRWCWRRIFLYQNAPDALPGQAPHRFHSGRVQLMPAIDSKVMMCLPVGGGRAVTRPFQAFAFKIQHHGRLSYSCTSSGVPRSMWRCSARRSGHHRLHEGRAPVVSVVSVGLRQRFSCSARSMAVTVSSIRRAFSRWAARPFPVVPARVADIQGWCCQTFPAPRHFRLRNCDVHRQQRRVAVCQP